MTTTCSAPGKIDSIAATGDFAQSNGCPLPISNSSVSGEVVTCNIAVTFTMAVLGHGDHGSAEHGIPKDRVGIPHIHVAAQAGTQ